MIIKERDTSDRIALGVRGNMEAKRSIVCAGVTVA